MAGYQSNRLVNRSNRPVNQSEPVAREFLNLFEFGFKFNRFPPVTGPTGPVNRNRWPAVWVNRSGKKTLGVTRVPVSSYAERHGGRGRDPSVPNSMLGRVVGVAANPSGIDEQDAWAGASACLGGYDATIIACWVMRREGSIGRRAEGDGRAAGRARRVAVDGYIPAAAPPVAVVSLSVLCTSVSAVCRARGCSSWSRREQLEVYLKRALRGLMFFSFPEPFCHFLDC